MRKTLDIYALLSEYLESYNLSISRPLLLFYPYLCKSLFDYKNISFKDIFFIKNFAI